VRPMHKSRLCTSMHFLGAFSVQVSREGAIKALFPEDMCTKSAAEAFSLYKRDLYNASPPKVANMEGKAYLCDADHLKKNSL